MKWSNYYPVYEKCIPPTVNKILEIGVNKGEGLEWLSRKYSTAKLFGMDIDTSSWSEIRKNNSAVCGLFKCNQCFIPDKVLSEMGALDVVIDDGGHRPYQQAAAFKKLWSILKDGGLYFIEDMHMCERLHWRLYSKFFGIHAILRKMLHDMNRWKGAEAPMFRSPLLITYTPQLIVIQKGSVFCQIQ